MTISQKCTWVLVHPKISLSIWSIVFFLVHRQHFALRVAHLVGSHKFVRAVGRVLVGHRLGNALAHSVVVEVEVGLVALLGADHVGDLARHRPTDLGDLLALVLDEVAHLVVDVVVGRRLLLGVVVALVLDVSAIGGVRRVVHVQQSVAQDITLRILGVVVRQVVHRRARLVVAGQGAQ